MTFNKKECTEILGVSLQTLDRLTKNKKIESMNITRHVLFSIEEIAKVLSEDKQMKWLTQLAKAVGISAKNIMLKSPSMC